MVLILSCVKCGYVHFDKCDKETYESDGMDFLHPEDAKGAKVICGNCGLEDYIENLYIRVE